MSKFEEGDHVRVTFEGRVSHVKHSREGKMRVTSQGEGFGPSETFAWIGSDAQVEKIEPPVETFKPGDVLREVGGTTLVALGQEGYIYLNNWDPGEQFKYGVGVPLSHFTSRDFERVDIS